MEESQEIEAIDVINASAWLKGADHKVIEPLTDLPVLYGRRQYEIAQDDKLIREVWSSGLPASAAFLSEGRSLKKFYEPMPDGRVVTIVMNMDRQKEFKNLFITTLSIAFVLIFVATQKVGALIWRVKTDVDSMSLLSSLLTKRVYTSLDAMNEVSVHMTHEAKSSLIELQTHIELLKQSLNALIEHKPPDGSVWKDSEDSERLEKEIIAINGHMDHLGNFVEIHTNHVTSFSIMLFDTLQELADIIGNLDKLSQNLKEKIEVFQLYEDNA